MKSPSSLYVYVGWYRIQYVAPFESAIFPSSRLKKTISPASLARSHMPPEPIPGALPSRKSPQLGAGPGGVIGMLGKSARSRGVGSALLSERVALSSVVVAGCWLLNVCVLGVAEKKNHTRPVTGLGRRRAQYLNVDRGEETDAAPG